MLLVCLSLAIFPCNALEYALPGLDGRVQTLDQYQGKWVVVNYWATWCGTCMKELPELAALHEKHSDDDIVVVGINFESISTDRLKAFVEANAIPLPVLRSEPMEVTPIGPVPALPTTYIIDPDGRVVAGEVGLLHGEDIVAYIAGRQKAGSE